MIWKQSSHLPKSPSYLFGLRWWTQTTSSWCGGDSSPVCGPPDLKEALADLHSPATVDPGQTSYFLPTAEYNGYRIHQESFGEGGSMLHESVWHDLRLDKVWLTLTSSRWGLSHLSLSVKGSAIVSHCSTEKASPGRLEAVVLNMPVKQCWTALQEPWHVVVNPK